MPLGRCTNIEIEVQDPSGYRTGLLSNGQSLDQRKFVFTSSDVTSFEWRGPTTDGVICAKAGAPPATTTIRVELPDGIVGVVQLTSVVPGTAATPVSYEPQAPIRLPNSPRFAPNHVATSVATAASAPGIATGPPAQPTPQSLNPSLHPIAAGVSPFIVKSASVTTAPITGVGGYWAPAETIVSTAPIAGVGAYWLPGAIIVSTQSITGVGPYWAPTTVSISAAPIQAVGNAGVTALPATASPPHAIHVP